ncbi:MAG TPA: biotin/lipoyl-containing protein [Solirubrobacterales bacterium]|nr:biotin/lipoyl-containing protein [Solirubrobacterales bacterium]
MSFSPSDSAFLRGSSARTVEVTLPELGAAAIEATIAAWEKHPGEWVEQDEPICIVSGHGLRAAVASSASGHLVRLMVEVGARITAGTSLAEIAVSDVEPEEPEVGPPSGPEPEHAAEETPTAPESGQDFQTEHPDPEGVPSNVRPPAVHSPPWTDPVAQPDGTTQPRGDQRPSPEGAIEPQGGSRPASETIEPQRDSRAEPARWRLQGLSFHSPAVRRLARRRRRESPLNEGA